MGVVLAPVNGKGSAARLIEAGAGELYWGFADEEWTARFGWHVGLNRMSGFGEEANSLSFEELLEEVRGARALAPQAGLFCTFNSPHYTSEQRRFVVQRYLPALADAGLTGIIVSEPVLIACAREAGLGAVASTMCAVYNEELARFYRDAGATRIILPRDLGLDEIEGICAAVPGPSYEAFLMRNGCSFADSHCLGLHRAGCPSLCRSLRTATRWEVPTGKRAGGRASGEAEPAALPLPADAPASAPASASADDFLHARWESGTTYRERFHKSACGQCALWRLEQAGVAAYKVVGRGDRVEDLATDVALTARNLAVAADCASHEEYQQRMHRPTWLRTLCADEGLSCYYPEVCARA